MKKKKRVSPNFTILKMFISIALISTVVAMLLLILNILSVGTIMSDSGDVFPNYPKGILADITDNFSVITDETGKTVSCTLTDESVLPADYWCVLLNEAGDIVWSLRKPTDIPDHYSINDIAVLTRWFLVDYPVYVRAEDYGLFILGAPKFSVGKYSIEYSMDWFHSLPFRVFCIFLINFTLAAVLTFFFGFFLYRKIKLLTKGLENLKKEKIVSLPAKGIFKEPFSNINQTSQTLARKNAQLAVRDKARSNWISGISHDIRTPLSMVVGYGGQLAENTELSEENRKYASIITAQGLKIKKLIEDLNLISSLEYDMQPTHKTPLQISVLLRSVVGEIYNSGLINSESALDTTCPPKNTESTENTENDENSDETVQGQPVYDIILSLHCGQAMVFGDNSLLSRAFYNLLQNSIVHNKNGCLITVSGSVQGDSVLLVIADNGLGVPEKVLENLDILPNTAHGFGLPMAYKIIRAHGGSFRAENKDGFIVTIELPLIP